jgi:hypothetical protein
MVLVLLLQEIDHFSVTFLICNFFLCASVLSLGQCVITEAGCNWYLLDINICSLSKIYSHKVVLRENKELCVMHKKPNFDT